MCPHLGRPRGGTGVAAGRIVHCLAAFAKHHLVHSLKERQQQHIHTHTHTRVGERYKGLAAVLWLWIGKPMACSLTLGTW